MRMRLIIWPVWICNIFQRYLIDGTILDLKKSYQTWNLCFYVLYNSSEIFLILGTGRDTVRNVYPRQVPVILVRLYWNFNFSQFGKRLNIRFHENTSSETRVFFLSGQAGRRIDRHDEAVAFRSLTNAPKKIHHHITYVVISVVQSRPMGRQSYVSQCKLTQFLSTECLWLSVNAYWSTHAHCITKSHSSNTFPNLRYSTHTSTLSAIRYFTRYTYLTCCGTGYGVSLPCRWITQCRFPHHHVTSCSHRSRDTSLPFALCHCTIHTSQNVCGTR